MILPIFVVLGLLLNLPQSLEIQDLDLRDIILDQHVTGVLGEEVYLRCLYTGQNSISVSSWKRLDSSRRAKMMAGYKNGRPFSKDNFSNPASQTNLTVKVSIVSLDMEGQYTCVFSTDEEETMENLFLTVIARPHVNTHVEEEVLNGTHYQSIFCSASNAKPMVLLRWDIHGAPPSEDIFSIHTTNSTLPNGTAIIVSVLRFPIHLNNESSVACVIQHPALTEPSTTNIKLQTFVSPNVTMEMVIQKEEKGFLEVLCTATGGRPHPSITWILPESLDTSRSQGSNVAFESVSSSYWFPSDVCKGENITCIFGYPHLPAIHTRTVTLPTYQLNSFQLTNRSVETNRENASDRLVLEEGDSDIIIKMKVLGNVPSYEINCTKDGEPLPEDVDVVDSDLLIKGPAWSNHAGQYQCQASYYRHTASLQFDIEVKPRVLVPVTFTPNISVNLRKEASNVYIECSASDTTPTINVSWVLPKDLKGTIKFNITYSNGSHLVKSILMLPACLPQKLTIDCVVEHLVLTSQERRQIVLPNCVPTSVTLQSNTLWENGIKYIEVKCRADNVSPDATITWNTTNCRLGISASEPGNAVIQSGSQQDHSVVWNTAHLSVHSYAGCTVICVVDHQGLEGPVQKSIHIPLIGSFNVSVGPQKDSLYWAAVCEYKSDGVIPIIFWVISDSNTTALPSSNYTTKDSSKMLVKSIYEFVLSQHEGKSLTCVIQNDYGEYGRKTIHVPKHFISSIVILNKTIPLHGNHGQHTGVHRVALQEHVPNQRIVFRVNGNVSAHNIKCFRANGFAAHTVGMALVFAEKVSVHAAGLYTCNVFWYHHNATVVVLVEVSSHEAQSMTLILICFSTAVAIALIFIVTLCIFCKRNGETHSSTKDWKKRESLAALMQDPRSPELKKAGGKGQEYAEIVHYSIVIDVKSTV